MTGVDRLDVRDGKVVVKTSGTTVTLILDHLAGFLESGDDPRDLAELYGLITADVADCIRYARQLVDEVDRG